MMRKTCDPTLAPPRGGRADRAAVKEFPKRLETAPIDETSSEYNDFCCIKSTSTFLDEELADIFTLKDTQCETHDLLGCQCDGSGLLPHEFEEEPEEENSSEDVAVSPDDEIFDDGDEENSLKQGEELAEDVQDEPATMAELFRWRHYSPRHPEQWEYFKSVAGFGDTPLSDLTFAFHLSSKF
ncbi:hypothetical protein Y032_0311g2133 [Ancylostoma ceylanicum]|uniref:Uncharacterized protein n=1 Tax=Ancylostoma ceylanicum TaxID=53326 RepID=A0A016S242_9BILA|nr:hypothetical protein Y032_0311g2133 [Ancylostoma ceylanicum]